MQCDDVCTNKDCSANSMDSITINLAHSSVSRFGREHMADADCGKASHKLVSARAASTGWTRRVKIQCRRKNNYTRGVKRSLCATSGVGRRRWFMKNKHTRTHHVWIVLTAQQGQERGQEL